MFLRIRGVAEALALEALQATDFEPEAAQEWLIVHNTAEEGKLQQGFRVLYKTCVL